MPWNQHTGGRRRANGGARADLGGRYYRSSWEANIARYLNLMVAHGHYQQVEYEVETFFFPVKSGPTGYLPDWRLKTHDPEFPFVRLELKGYLDRASVTKLKRMAKYFPTVPLILMDADLYHEVEADYAPQIAEWEYPRRSYPRTGASGPVQKDTDGVSVEQSPDRAQNGQEHDQ